MLPAERILLPSGAGTTRAVSVFTVIGESIIWAERILN
jgi:hypothetical protein